MPKKLFIFTKINSVLSSILYGPISQPNNVKIIMKYQTLKIPSSKSIQISSQKNRGVARVLA